MREKERERERADNLSDRGGKGRGVGVRPLGRERGGSPPMPLRGQRLADALGVAGARRQRLLKSRLRHFLYRGTSLIRNRPPPGPYCRIMPRALWWP